MYIKKLTFLFAILIGLAVIVISMLIASIFSFISTVIQPSSYLESGSTIYIDTGRTHSIYIEDNSPPLFFTHQFIFTNTETQAVFHSSVPTVGSRYSTGVVTINNEIQRGRFGTRIAIVYLEPGTYIIEFLPHEGTGEFVWGSTREIVFSFAIRMIVLTLIFFVIIVVFIVVLEMHRRQKTMRMHEAVPRDRGTADCYKTRKRLLYFLVYVHSCEFTSIFKTKNEFCNNLPSLRHQSSLKNYYIKQMGGNYGFFKISSRSKEPICLWGRCA